MAFFVDSVYGSDSNSGLSSALPKKSLAAALALFSLTGTEILYGSGDFRDEQIVLTSYSNKTITQWPLDNAFPSDPPGTLHSLPVGTTLRAFRLRGDILVTGSWTSIGNGVYTNTIPTGLTLSGLAYGWDTKAVSAAGQHSWGMVLVASAAAVTTYATGTGGAKGVFFYASGSGLITAYFGGDNPNSSGHAVGYMTSQAREAAVRLITCTNITVSNMAFALYPVHSGQFGWTVRWEGSAGCAAINCTADDMGAHGFGTLGGNGNSSGNSIINCTIRACAPAATSLIFHGLIAEGNLTGCVASGGALVLKRWLGIDGAVMHGRGDTVAALSGNTQYGLYAHADSGTPIRGVSMTGSIDIQIPEAGATPWGCENTPVPSSGNRWAYSAYPVQIDLCTVSGAGLSQINWSLTGSKSIAVRRTRWTQGTTFGSDSAAILMTTVATVNQYFLWECCEFTVDLSDGSAGGATNYLVFAGAFTGGTQGMMFLNCSFYDQSTQTPSSIHGIVNPNNEDKKYVEMIGCVFAFKTPSTTTAWFWNNNTFTTANHGVLDCIEYGVDETSPRWSFAGYPHFDTAHWFSEVDTAGTAGRNNLSASPYAAPGTNLELTTAAKAIKRTTSAIIPSAGGINLMAYSGNMGARQYPSSGALLGSSRPGRIKRVRRVKRT